MQQAATPTQRVREKRTKEAFLAGDTAPVSAPLFILKVLEEIRLLAREILPDPIEVGETRTQDRYCTA
jgi:hypothetical protein